MPEKRRSTGNLVLGQYLAARRLAGGMPYRELAEKVGKSPATIQAWEQGKRMPGLDDLFVLANALNADLGELINIAATPVKELKKQLAAAENRYKRAVSKGRTSKEENRSEVTQAGREVAFLQNLLSQRKKQEQKLGKPPLAVPLYDLRAVPVIGSIRAGRPRLAAEDKQGYTGVSHDINVDYALTIDGDSMVGAGLEPGDVVWVKQTGFANHGDTVVALIENQDVTVKHLIMEGGRYLLRANNPERDYPDIVLGPEDRVIGVVQRVVKRPGPPPKVSRR